MDRVLGDHGSLAVHISCGTSVSPCAPLLPQQLSPRRAENRTPKYLSAQCKIAAASASGPGLGHVAGRSYNSAEARRSGRRDPRDGGPSLSCPDGSVLTIASCLACTGGRPPASAFYNPNFEDTPLMQLAAAADGNHEEYHATRATSRRRGRKAVAGECHTHIRWFRCRCCRLICDSSLTFTDGQIQAFFAVCLRGEALATQVRLAGRETLEYS
jgi:hypothetical protein